jgi:hypothetical protein
MDAGWKVFWLFGAAFAVALGMERTYAPDVVPIAFATEPQPLELAFALRTLELTTGGVAAVALVLMVSVWAQRLNQYRALKVGVQRHS